MAATGMRQRMEGNMSQPTDGRISQILGRCLRGLGIALVAASLATPAQAASAVISVPQCADHEKMVDILAKEYRELPKALGIVRGERVMQLFVSAAGTWTIVVTKTSGASCIVASGQDWEEVPAEAQSLEPRA